MSRYLTILGPDGKLVYRWGGGATKSCLHSSVLADIGSDAGAHGWLYRLVLLHVVSRWQTT